MRNYPTTFLFSLCNFLELSYHAAGSFFLSIHFLSLTLFSHRISLSCESSLSVSRSLFSHCISHFEWTPGCSVGAQLSRRKDFLSCFMYGSFSRSLYLSSLFQQNLFIVPSPLPHSLHTSESCEMFSLAFSSASPAPSRLHSILMKSGRILNVRGVASFTLMNMNEQRSVWSKAQHHHDITVRLSHLDSAH